MARQASVLYLCRQGPKPQTQSPINPISPNHEGPPGGPAHGLATTVSSVRGFRGLEFRGLWLEEFGVVRATAARIPGLRTGSCMVKPACMNIIIANPRPTPAPADFSCWSCCNISCVVRVFGIRRFKVRRFRGLGLFGSRCLGCDV